MKNSLKISNLCFQFSKDKPFFFKDFSAEFQAGKIHAIQGKNGSGKSTLMRILQGKLLGDDVVTGQLQLGEHVVDLGHSQASLIFERIKMVSQKFDTMLADQLSFTDNLKLANIAHIPMLASLPAPKPLPDFLERFDIDMNKPVKLLSGGQRQILAILMILQKPCDVLLLDEPTAALDDKNATMVMDFIRDLLQTTPMTVLMVCHDRELVQKYADSCLVMDTRELNEN